MVDVKKGDKNMKLEDYEGEYILYTQNGLKLMDAIVGEEPIKHWKDIKVVKSSDYTPLQCNVSLI